MIDNILFSIFIIVAPCILVYVFIWTFKQAKKESKK